MLIHKENLNFASLRKKGRTNCLRRQKAHPSLCHKLLTGSGNISGSKSLFFPSCIRYIYLVVRSHLNDIRNDSIVRDSDSLHQLITSNSVLSNIKVRTLGLPVVPLEQLRKANFVLASPGASVLSTNEVGRARPSSTRSGTVGYGPFITDLSMRIIWSFGMLH